MTTPAACGLHEDHSPVGVAWRAAGSPTPAAATVTGNCARCWATGPLVPIDQVVSRGFTGFEEWVAYPGAGVCQACSWAYRSPALRREPHLVTRTPEECRLLRGADLQHLLMDPIAPTTAVTVPRRAGRKHVLPHARWGRVALDDVLLEWTSTDADRLGVVAQLRVAGVTAVDLTSPAPPWRLLARRDGAARRYFLDQWIRLDPWRASPAWLDLAVLATGPTR